MADGVVGTVSLSLQLLGGCIKGFVLLSTAGRLGKDASSIMCMLNMQEMQLTNWAREAGLLTGNGTLDSRLNPRAVEVTLQTLQALLLDTETLKTRYGLALVPQSGGQGQTAAQLQAAALSDLDMVMTAVSDDTRRQVLQRAKLAQGQNLFKRLWWAAVDKDNIEKLVSDVRFLVRGLCHMLEPQRHQDVLDSTAAITSSLVSINHSFRQLTLVSETLNALRGDVLALPDAVLKGLAASAEIKALRTGLGDDDQDQQEPSPPDAPPRQHLLGKLEPLSRSKLTNFQPLKRAEGMGLADYAGQRVFVEHKAIDPLMRSKLMPRAENLAALLNLPKSETFRSLSCRGVIEESDRATFVFHHPTPDRPEAPRSLLHLFSAKDGIEAPSLTVRLQLAVIIAKTLQSFHRAGWLHKSLRSENILFFANMPSRHVIADPVLAGFAFARMGSPTEISEQPSAEPKHDIYRHPQALGEPTASFRPEMDAYSLGVVLLEIAEWRALRYLVDSVVDVSAADVPLSTLSKVQPFLLRGRGRGGTAKLPPRMGDIYTQACVMCLGGKCPEDKTGETTSGTELSLLDFVVRRLESCNV
ncbi:hypothetical protein G6O67_001077 [Ophiocordyceps sinensis]|uniref:Protein kinase domain-containing protein n=1 Tax=Ophiocordyceps sinensis TaxID=72228 RepID=A0A8H4PX46_9HYPO|nr:hypothetical protein G6O67_001077 [Ophiocordyceps sinensis]